MAHGSEPEMESRSKRPEYGRDSTARQQSALAELSQLALQKGDLTELFEESVSLITQILQLRYSEVLEYQPESNTFLLRAGLGWNPGSVGNVTIPVAREFQAGYTFLSQKRVVIDDYELETPFHPSPLLEAHRCRSGITVHISGPNLPYGVLGGYSASARHFTADDVNFMRSVANIIAAAMHRKHNEESIRHSELYFRGLLESAPDGMAIINSEGRIALVNKETERLFGYPREELVGQSIEILVPERYRAFHKQHRSEFMSDPRSRPMGVGLELFGRRKDGTEFPVEISLSPVNSPNGPVVTAAIRDVSERNKAEAQIKKLNAQLEEALRRSERLAVTGRLWASLAHEINNPLAALNDLLFALASRKELNEDLKKLVQSAQQEAERLATIARETLAPHRNAGQTVKIKASELIEASLASFRRQLLQTKIQVDRRYESDAVIEVFPSELRQVFTNLICNAIDAMPQGGTLSLEVSQEGAAVKLLFADTGTGIHPDLLDGLFEPFVTTKGEHGLGIGLWISRTLVEKMGGTIEVKSSVDHQNHGTLFTIRLPIASTAHAGMRLVS